MSVLIGLKRSLCNAQYHLVHDLYNLLHCSLQGFCYILDVAKQLLFLVLYINNWKVRKNMNADMKWLDNPEVFKVNQLEPHSDHCYYLDYSDMKKEKIHYYSH